ncbi:hypothetical protein R3P38DRAFT_3350585 [Favolaschia claudopus]|uniref:F-box domain-containing protein n=1 Tax=Favolaschia claudopus TaxID=2862362 RepID=A0AAW0CK87_9AGAR
MDSICLVSVLHTTVPAPEARHRTDRAYYLRVETPVYCGPRLFIMSDSTNIEAPSQPLSKRIVAALQKTNNIPPEQYISALRQELATAQHELTACQADREALCAERKSLRKASKARGFQDSRKEIANARNVQRQIDTVKDRIDRLQRRILALTSILSPIRRFPAEILCGIFHFWLAAEPPYLLYYRYRRLPTLPWSLTHVCQYWRAAARGDPSLWSHIRIDAGTVNRGNFLVALEAQLELTLQTPLRLELLDVTDASRSEYWDEDFRYRPNATMHTFAGILCTLVSHSNRWQTLTLCIPSPDEYSLVIPILASIKGHLDCLKSLRIEGQMMLWPKELENLFEETPNLQEALLSQSMHGLEQDRPYPPFGIAWSHLTCLEIYASTAVSLGILHQTADLEELVVGACDSDDQPPLIDNVVLRNLRRLFLAGTEIVQYLTTPALEYLDLIHGNITILYIADLLLRSKCQLRSLALTSPHGEPDIGAVETLLQALPSLSYLELRCQRYGTEPHCQLLKRLIPLLVAKTTPSDNLCPKLISICIEFPCPTIADEVGIHLCEMLESRWHITAERRFLGSVIFPPDRLPVRSSMESTPGMRQRLNALQKAGLNFEGL